MSSDTSPEAEIEGDGTDIFVVIKGVGRIAKRGRPKTPYARQWIALLPGWHVTGGGDGKPIVITRPPVEIH